MALPQRIRTARRAAGLRVIDLAKAIGRDRSTVLRYERGATEPVFSDVLKIADITGRPLDYFARGEEAGDA